MQEEKDALLNEAAQAVADEPPETDQEQQLVEGLAQAELVGRVKNAAETYNLAKDLDDGLLREVGEEAFNGFRDDDDSRQDWLKLQAFWLALDMQQDYAENSDAERDWGATESVPILTETCNQFQNRTYKAFFPQDTFVSAKPMRKTTRNRKEIEKRAERVGNHMSWQLGYMDPSYKQDKDALFRGVARSGSFFTKTYFKDKTKRWKVDNVRPTDLVINYNVGPIRIEDVRRKSHIIYTTVGETEESAMGGFLLSGAKSCQQEGKNVYNVKVDETLGITEPQYTLKADRPAILVEQQLYLDIDGNGFRPYLVTFDLADHRVKRMCIDYAADQFGNPLKDYEQNQYYTHYKYRENPDGFYGLGAGQDIGDLNSAINIALRQTMDAGTLQNDGNNSGFVSERLGLEGDEIRMVLGKYVKIPDTVGDLTNSLMQMKFNGPSEALIKIIEFLDMRAQRMGSLGEATTGTMDKVVQPTTYLAMVEQALEPLSSVQMRLANSMTEEFQKIYKINQKFLPLIDYYMVNEAPELITRADYADDMLIRPIFDPKNTTQGQKIARTQAAAQVVMQNPLTAQRPQVMDEITRRQLEALGEDDIDKLVPPSEPIRIDNPLEENMMLLMPPGSAPPFDAFPDQDHIIHMAAIDELLGTQGEAMLPEQQQAAVMHKIKHNAFLYGMTHGLIPPPQQPGDASLEAGPGDEMGNGAIENAVPGAQAIPIGGDMGAAAPFGGAGPGN